MKPTAKNFHRQFRKIKVFALVGRSGTGKSFRAKLVAHKYGVELIIDDGLLIKDKGIIAGRSAKRDETYIAAIKTALFEDPAQCIEVQMAILQEKPNKILLLGTSNKMIAKIASRLELPEPHKVINISDISTTEEIEWARSRRLNGGEHVIPVPAVEINRNYSSIFYDSIRVFMKNRFPIGRASKGFEKTVVQPGFGSKGRTYISEDALKEMILHCVDEFDDSIKLKAVTSREGPRGHAIEVVVAVPYGIRMSKELEDIREYIFVNLERNAGILIHRIDIKVGGIWK